MLSCRRESVIKCYYTCYNSNVQLRAEQIYDFQNNILSWYKKHKRDLPWRRTRDPYHILVSEVMLQQTQVARVIPKFETWLTQFPTISDLAKAKVSDVLSYWSGLGYNRRALNLKKTAEIIVRDFAGKFPQQEKQLLLLPGIGTYTARAVLCFAFDKQVAVVDTNVRKVILTQNFVLRDDKKTDDKELQNFAEQLLPRGNAYEWNQALMDYASHVLKKEKIPIPKQSKFIGSHRYYRGQILKTLLQKKKIKMNEIGMLIKKDFSLAEKDWLKKLLKELVKEGFIVIKKDTIVLAQ